MATIGTQSLSQLVKVNAAAQKNLLDIGKALNSPEADAFLSEKFRPLSSQIDALRQAFESISGGSAVLVGACGTGKTSLQILLGKLAGLDSSSEAFASVLRNINDASCAKLISQVRSAEHSWEIIVPDLSASDLEKALISALKASASKNNIENIPEGDAAQAYSEYTANLKKSGLYEGAVILLDKADDFVKKAVKDPSSDEAQALRHFSEACRAENSGMFLCACLDYDISRLSIKEEENASEILGQVIPVSLLGQAGEFEEFVSSSVIEHAGGDLWDALVEYKDIRSVAEGLSKAGLYKGSSDKWIMDNVLLGSYPMHPAALFALPHLSGFMAGGVKTALNLFSDSAPGGLFYFLRNFAIVQPNGRLHLYTIDSLYTYFEKVFTADPDNAEYVKTLNKCILTAGDIPQARRILRTVLLIQLISHDRFKTTADTIIWAMHMGEREARVALNSLELLKNKGALSYIEDTQEYMLPIERKKVTLDEAVSRMCSRIRTQVDTDAVLKSEFPVRRIFAEKFNEAHFTDRFVGVDIISASELSRPEAFMRSFEESFKNIRPYRGDMRFVIAVPETDAELAAVSTAADAGAFDNERLILAVPSKTAAVSKDAILAAALEKITASELPFCDPNSLENIRAKERLEDCRARLKESVSTLLDVASMRIRCGGKDFSGLDMKGISELADKSVEALIGDSPILSCRELLCMRESGSAFKTRHALLSCMLSCRGSFAVRDSSEAVISLMEACLAETGFVAEEECGRGWRQFKMTGEIPETEMGRAYKFICDEAAGFAGSCKVSNMSGVAGRLMRAPYGLTPASVEILLALYISQYRYSIRIHKNASRALIENNSELLKPAEPSAETIISIVSEPDDWQITFKDCTDFQRDGLNELISFAAGEETDTSKERGSLWKIADIKLFELYSRLPKAAKYQFSTENEGADKIIRFMNSKVKSAEDLRHCSLLKINFPILFGADINDSEECTRYFAELKAALESLKTVVSGRISKLSSALKDIFVSVEGEDDLQWHARAYNWLSSAAVYGENEKWAAEFAAIQAAAAADSEEALDAAVEALGYPNICDWEEDLCDEILERFRVMRQDIEWGSYRHSYIMPKSSMVAFGVIQSVLENLRSESLEDFLVSELEWASWPEAVAERLKQEGLVPEQGDSAEWTYDKTMSSVLESVLAHEEEAEEVKQESEPEESEAEEIIVEEEIEEPEASAELAGAVPAEPSEEKSEAEFKAAEPEAAGAAEAAEEDKKEDASEAAEEKAEAAEPEASVTEENLDFDLDESALQWL